MTTLGNVLAAHSPFRTSEPFDNLNKYCARILPTHCGYPPLNRARKARTVVYALPRIFNRPLEAGRNIIVTGSVSIAHRLDEVRRSRKL